MPDLAVVAAILSSIKSAMDIAKGLKDADLSLEKAELKLKLADLVSALADAKIQMASVQDALSDRDHQIRELENALKVRGDLKWEEPYYWLLDGQAKEGPFCQQCYDKDRKLIRLQGNGEGFWQCKTCDNNYPDSTYSHDMPRSSGSRRLAFDNF